MKIIVHLVIFVFFSISVYAEDGHNLWLRHSNPNPVNVVCAKTSPTLILARQELQMGWKGDPGTSVSLIIKADKAIHGDGYRISKNAVQANTEFGILYGVFELLRRQQTGVAIHDEISNPSYDRRILNHWDNLNGSVERGYAGLSIFWREGKDALTVTEKDKTLWQEYARASALIGINGQELFMMGIDPLKFGNHPTGIRL